MSNIQTNTETVYVVQSNRLRSYADIQRTVNQDHFLAMAYGNRMIEPLVLVPGKVYTPLSNMAKSDIACLRGHGFKIVKSLP